jgi:hypothetical protein
MGAFSKEFFGRHVSQGKFFQGTFSQGINFANISA